MQNMNTYMQQNMHKIWHKYATNMQNMQKICKICLIKKHFKFIPKICKICNKYAKYVSQNLICRNALPLCWWFRRTIRESSCLHWLGCVCVSAYNTRIVLFCIGYEWPWGGVFTSLAFARAGGAALRSSKSPIPMTRMNQTNWSF